MATIRIQNIYFNKAFSSILSGKKTKKIKRYIQYSDDDIPRTLNSPDPSKRASNPNAVVSLSKPSRSTRTIVRKMTNEVKNPYIDATITIIQ